MHIFGPQLANSQVIFHSDNEAVVFILDSETSKDTMIMKIKTTGIGLDETEHYFP